MDIEKLSIGSLDGKQAEIVRCVLAAALDAADPRRAVRLALQETGWKFSDFGRVRVAGVGKAAVDMALGALDVIGDGTHDGLLITKHVPVGVALPTKIQVYTGGHPVPTEKSVDGSRALVEFLSCGNEDDLVVCLISGGGSALMTLPLPGTNLADLQEMTRLLLACGATINEMNCLRKHLDQLKGGGVARITAPARMATLILSDVIGSPLDVIASGPTVADTTTYADALSILEKYDLLERVPLGIRAVLASGSAGEIPETVKPGDAVLMRGSNQLVASNRQAADAALNAARAAGLNAHLLTTYLQGEAAQAGAVLASLLKEIAASGQPLPRPACIVAGGETTVTLRGQGKGGRNQELALGAAALLDGVEDVALVTLATDGEDGPTDAAGAVVTGQTIRRAVSTATSPYVALRENDSYAFFAALGDLVKTGPTGTNVNDLTFLFAF